MTLPDKRPFAGKVGDGTPGPGRKKGGSNKSTREMKAAFREAFDLLGGVPSLVGWAKDNPTEFYKLAARLIPTEHHIGGNEGQPLGVILVPVKQVLEPDA